LQVKSQSDLNRRLVTAEQRSNELQRKYDDSKRNYYKVRDERERLKIDLEKAKGTSAAADSEEGALVTQAATGKLTSNGTADVQAKYESLKTKYRVSAHHHLLLPAKRSSCSRSWGLNLRGLICEGAAGDLDWAKIFFFNCKARYLDDIIALQSGNRR
jgi:hypothetical protein